MTQNSSNTASETSITLRTLTPLWTGGANGRSDDRLHLTGIIGSLRWWYEVIVRGVGGSACDPSQHPCLYNPDKPPYYGLCDVCRVFGATGWARRFRLIANDAMQLRPDLSYDREPTASRRYIDRFGKTVIPKWYLKSPPLHGSITLRIVATDKRFQTAIIGILLQFIADWASLGARPQMGFGVIEMTPHLDIHSLIDHLMTQLQPATSSVVDRNLPSLKRMFFTRVQAKAGKLPENETFNLKYDIRRLFSANNDVRHFVMGEAPQKGERQGAKIMVSDLYGNGMIRLWGWIPEEEVANFGLSRQQVIAQIHSHLTTNYTSSYWRSFNSTYDTVQQQYDNPKDFLVSLLKGEGKP